MCFRQIVKACAVGADSYCAKQVIHACPISDSPQFSEKPTDHHLRFRTGTDAGRQLTVRNRSVDQVGGSNDKGIPAITTATASVNDDFPPESRRAVKILRDYEMNCVAPNHGRAITKGRWFLDLDLRNHLTKKNHTARIKRLRRPARVGHHNARAGANGSGGERQYNNGSSKQKAQDLHIPIASAHFARYDSQMQFKAGGIASPLTMSIRGFMGSEMCQIAGNCKGPRKRAIGHLKY